MLFLRIVPHLETDFRQSNSHHSHPHPSSPSRTVIFNIIERTLSAATQGCIKIGRQNEANQHLTDHITFKSNVVSRVHAELVWDEEENQVYIKDAKSSSGTFVNRMRLSPPNQESRLCLLHHGDIVQLGVDYQGGVEEIFRCIKMRVEIYKESPQQHLPLKKNFGLKTFRSLRNLALSMAPHEQQDEDVLVKEMIDECCICLYAIAPFQALFVAPCSHTFHFKCCYPLLRNYPGFNCPLCRTYADLSASVSIEADEVGLFFLICIHEKKKKKEMYNSILTKRMMCVVGIGNV
ncbi:hypothetical protein BDF20DRAFT_879301 [Mycotypha africana]|uniref:uncharacterized protein n=1 Tax=Mycotypha africana TaxID=64632 RepID=UPI0023000885|nr:uncharacterized protein BDF20DRAFT_879301 [Mycotypha africana]KAI8975554.1 hypothetical protein BDF20DRAFT_879301 [Mycotypha africana]